MLMKSTSRWSGAKRRRSEGKRKKEKKGKRQSAPRRQLIPASSHAGTSPAADAAARAAGVRAVNLFSAEPRDARQCGLRVRRDVRRDVRRVQGRQRKDRPV